MRETIFARLARKIEASKARAEAEKAKGGLRKDATGWSYNPGVLPPASAPAKPAQPNAGTQSSPSQKTNEQLRAQVWYRTKTSRPPQTGMYAIAFANPRNAWAVPLYGGGACSYWDGCDWHLYGPTTGCIPDPDTVWWTFP